MKIFHSLKEIKIILIVNVILSFTKCAYDQSIYLSNDFYNYYNKELDFYVFVSEDYFTNYLKLEVECLYSNNEIAISFYQNDITFKERKQLSYRFSNSTFMWLNKNQFKNNFYFSVKCKTSYNCQYNLHIYKKQYAELNIGDIYSYYVTEENKDMTFLINLNYTKYYDSISLNSKISIWARGSNNNIDSKLEPNSFTNIIKDKYQAYLLCGNEIYINEHYYLKVQGNIGDLINVGYLLFDEYNICPIIFKDLGTEITGFFKENIFEKNCFKFIDSDENSFNQFIYDFEIKNYFENYEFYYNNNYILVCINFNKTYKYDEYLYSLQYVRNKIKNRLKYLVSPLIIGNNYKIFLKSDETIGLIPTKPDIDFNFLTYHANDLFGLCNYSIFECSTYPFCDSSILQTKNLLYKDGSYSISYTKNEYNNITPISLTQKVLLIKSIYYNNIININIYTDKNKIFVFPHITFYNFLRKNNEDNILIKLPYNAGEAPDSPYAYLSFEILSGDASINIETSKLSYLETIQDNTKKSFKFRLIRKNENLLKIKANKNTVYSIIYILEENNNIKRLTGNYILPIGNNYLYEIKNNSGDYYQYFNNELDYYGYTYFEFHPINCEIKVENNNTWNSLNKYKGFSYDFEEVRRKYSFKIRRVDFDTRKSCLVYASTLIYLKDFLKPTFLIISNNIPKYFFFHDNYEVNFLYYHSEIGNDLLVDFKMNHSIIYKYNAYYSYRRTTQTSYYLACYINNYNIYINNTYYNNISIYNNDSFKIKSYQIKNYCTDENQFCLIRFFIVKSIYNKNKNTVIELNVRTAEDPKSTSNFLKDNLKLIIIISGSVLFFIIIIIILICAVKKTNNKDLLALEVNKVSFEEERVNRNKAYEDGLLY